MIGCRVFKQGTSEHFVYVLNVFFFFHLFQRQREREKYKKRLILDLLKYPQSQDWIRPKPGAWNSI